jgi:hypothetical protein
VTQTITEGDHALLQMIYRFGKPVDEQRTIWLVDFELPLTGNPSFNVKSTFKFAFREGLPILPDWKDLIPESCTKYRSEAQKA